ncbi:hypothetical protein Goshw_004902, partial [Gossypium schwendimanii]|nr:hypothetical protein [Gossypium schwendimanii]
KQKGDSKCIPWKSLKDLILTHSDVRNKLDVFALSIYGLVVFPKALGHVDEAVVNLFDQLNKKVTPIPVILAETFKSLSACRKGVRVDSLDVQLLLAWFHSHFWKVDRVSYKVFSENYSPLKEIVATLRRDDISEKKWIAILQNLQEEDIEWRAPWLLPDEVLYRCGNFDWVPLLGIWGAVGYAPLLVLRQYIQNFERRNVDLEKKIEQMEEEKINLRLDIDVQKLETEKLRKRKNKVEEELDSLKTDYKKLRLSMKTARLGKTSEQWRAEIREEKNKADRWERKFQEMQMGNEAL